MHVVGVEDLDVADRLDVAGRDDARALLAHDHALRAVAFHLDGDFLDVQHDVGHVLAHAGDRGEFVQHAVDLHGGDGRALQRRQQHAAQRVAERQAEAALERLGDQRGQRLAPFDENSSLFGLISSCQFFWIIVDCPSVSLPPSNRGRRSGMPQRSAAALMQRSKCDAQTRRFLRGRQPLCGIGVTSRIEVIVKPAACSARSADSRPEPGPADLDFERPHAVFLRLLGAVLGGHLGGVRASTCASP